MPPKKSSSSKKSKKWRKNIDIRDVEDFLEEKRLEERLGNFETKLDEDLFVLDTAGENQPCEEKRHISERLRKREKLAQTPKCFEVLQPTSKVADPNTKRNVVKPIGSKETDLSKITEKRRLNKGVLQNKVETARQNKRTAIEQKKKTKLTRHTFNIDLWGEKMPAAKLIPNTLVDDFISPEAQVHNVHTDRRSRTKPPLSHTIVTRAVIETPPAGVSYNPSFEDHQKLLQEAITKEEELMKCEVRLNRLTTDMFSKVTHEQQMNQWRAEMSAGLPHKSNPTEDLSDSGSDNEYKAVNPPVKNKKKDLKTRRKQRERVIEKERLKRDKIDKKKITDLNKLRKLQSSITATENRRASLRSERASKRALEAATALPKLNARKVPPQEPDLVVLNQIAGDLLHTVSQTNLLRERFESLQRRGALAASNVMMKKNKKLKSYFKPGHKVTDQERDRYLLRNYDKK